jgi:hypothetical protein
VSFGLQGSRDAARREIGVEQQAQTRVTP